MRLTPTVREMLIVGFFASPTVLAIGEEPTPVQPTAIVIRAIPLSSAAQKLPPEISKEIAAELNQRFGDGVTFVISEQLPVNFGAADKERHREPGWLLSLGQNVFNTKCAECHGEFGDGQPSPEKKLRSRPRDFRRGVFKWKSTMPQHKSSRHDLDQTILLGLPGTDMPAFESLSDDDRRGVVEYVRWLSMRHELEWRVVKTSQDADVDDIRKDFDDYFKLISDNWLEGDLSESKVLPKEVPTFNADRVARGKTLFLDKAKCFTCHGADARGDGIATKDFWLNPETSEKYKTAGLHDAWGTKLLPRDFTSEPLRGGEDAIEIFRRISVGISGTPMPSFGSFLSEDEKWDLVAYVLSLRPENVKAVHRAPSPKSQTN
jgi:mono/diheme cytochrome c family protein